MASEKRHEKLKRAGLFTATLPLHPDFVKILTEYRDEECSFMDASTKLESTNTKIGGYIDLVMSQQRDILKNQLQIAKTILNGLQLSESDPTHIFCKTYLDTLLNDEKPRQKEGSDYDGGEAE